MTDTARTDEATARTDPLAVKVAKVAPSGATAVAELVAADSLGRVDGVRRSVLDRAGFSGGVGQTLVLEADGASRVLVGIGASGELEAASLRRAAASFARAVLRHRRIALAYPEGLNVDDADGVRAVAEGLVLGGYRFDVHKSADPPPRTTTATIAVGDRVRIARDAVRRAAAVTEGVFLARDLVNEPGGVVTPSVFVERVWAFAEDAGLGVEVYDEAAIEHAGLGGLMAVNQGSTEPPRLLKLTYDPAADDEAPPEAETVALVGKGITFDSGGLSIKSGDGMMEMKCDMAGAAAVVGAMTALPALEVGVRVVAFTPLTDNMINGAAQRPGDVFTARNGTTVEVLNTDAEGRLVLADALALAAEEEPAAIVDLATLTGACVVALGNKIAGLMGNDDDFVRVVSDAADAAGERVWHLPLPPDYRSLLDSQVADLKNIGGRFGGTLTAGLFLSEFVPSDVPWVHLDIAGPAFLSEPDGEYPKGATGFGVSARCFVCSRTGRAPTGRATEGEDAEPG